MTAVSAMTSSPVEHHTAKTQQTEVSSFDQNATLSLSTLAEEQQKWVRTVWQQYHVGVTSLCNSDGKSNQAEQIVASAPSSTPELSLEIKKTKETLSSNNNSKKHVVENLKNRKNNSPPLALKTIRPQVGLSSFYLLFPLLRTFYFERHNSQTLRS